MLKIGSFVYNEELGVKTICKILSETCMAWNLSNGEQIYKKPCLNYENEIKYHRVGNSARRRVWIEKE